MARPVCCRRIGSAPGCRLFKPAGVPASELSIVTMTLDELEALRLADLEGLYQEQAAAQMGVSRPTFGRIVESARHKAAEALVNGCGLNIEGGTVRVEGQRRFCCRACRHEWELPFGAGRPEACPACGGGDLGRADCTGISRVADEACCGRRRHRGGPSGRESSHK